ncbi:hypothetical protein [Streptosporangium sp. NPDC003464]
MPVRGVGVAGTGRVLPEVQSRSPSGDSQVGGGTRPLGVTRDITVTWPGTLALTVPVVEVTAFDHRSFSEQDDAPPMPASSRSC